MKANYGPGDTLSAGNINDENNIVSTEGFNYIGIILFPKLDGRYLIFIFCITGLFNNKNLTDSLCLSEVYNVVSIQWWYVQRLSVIETWRDVSLLPQGDSGSMKISYRDNIQDKSCNLVPGRS